MNETEYYSGIYDEKYVYFDYKEELKGQKCFIGDNILQLKKNVIENNTTYEVTPTLIMGKFKYYDLNHEEQFCTFAYYDPLYEYKKAIYDGLKVEYSPNKAKDWIPINKESVEKKEFEWNENYLYRIYYNEVNITNLPSNNSNNDNLDKFYELCKKHLKIRLWQDKENQIKVSLKYKTDFGEYLIIDEDDITLS